ncbi:hypothetical protein DNK10_06950 [Pseudomonas daroniae]|nr:hypothetical protein DNK10_06950 [Pseudomonas daroniae]
MENTMKKLISILAMLGLPASAWADFSVSPYTILDLSYNNVSNAAHKDGGSGNRGTVRVNSSYASRWGAKANYSFLDDQELFVQYEQAIRKEDGDIKTGLDKRYLRVALVGYRSPLGIVRYGQDYGISCWALDYDPLMGRLVSSSSQLYFRDQPFVGHALSYDSPEIGPFRARFQYSTEQHARGMLFDVKKTYGATLTYTRGDISVQAGMDEQYSPDGDLDLLFGYSRFSYLAGSWQLDDLTLLAGYSQLKARGAPVGTPKRADHAWFGGRYRMSPTWAASASLYQTDARQLGEASMLAGLLEYAASKHLSIWSSAAYMVNSGHSSFAVNGVDTPLPGQSQTSLSVGMTYIYR